MNPTGNVWFLLAASVTWTACASARNDTCDLSACDPAAVCATRGGDPVCACPDGFTDPRGDGTVCADIDECADGTATCGDSAVCQNTVGGFECGCPDGFADMGAGCEDIDECAEGLAECTGVTACRNLAGGYDCPCAAGYLDEAGDGSSCLPRATGRAVLFGHDFSATSATASEMLGNAVFTANTSGTVNIAGYVQFADVSAGGEVLNTNAAIESHAGAIGRAVSISTFGDPSQLASRLADAHVLLLYDQDQGNALGLTQIGQSWQTPLDGFIRGGGVVIAVDGSNTWRILDGAGVIDVVSAQAVQAGATLIQTEPANAVTFGVPTSYPAPAVSQTYAVDRAVKLVEDLPANFAVAQTGNFTGCLIVEDFESGVWPTGTWTAPEFLGGTASEEAAHDHRYGVIDPDFFYETDVLVGRPGQRVQAWVRLTGGGRAHIGVGSTSQSTFSFVLAADTDRVILQRNQFYLFEDQETRAYDVQLDTWYLLEAEFTTSSRITGRVYREDPNNPGQPLLNPDSVLAFDYGSLPVGGIAIRGTGGAHIDTVVACAP